MHSRHFVLVAAVASSAAPLHAQRADSAAVGVKAKRPDSLRVILPQPPLSPARAFAYSFVVPGLAQTRLNRPLAGALFALSESIGIAMLRESLADLHEAQRFRTDSLVAIGNDPVTGIAVFQRSSYTDGLISIRKGHVEDWIAFLVGNHLFAAADAYVASHLWDLPSQVGIAQTRAGPALAARLYW